MSEARQLRRGREAKAKKLLTLPPGKFERIDLKSQIMRPPWMTRAYSNNRYVVMINDNARTDRGTAIRAMIQRHDNTPIPNHWYELQQIKNEIFGKEKTGIEYFPKETELTDVFNIYWLWIFPEGIIPIPE